ncbi:hypothetical protein LOZ52_004510 [Ophidiomyces ophidiicola]|uniref:Uncharacterized protein n=1 Tax=Ophidiomyces ophidiicola TaxID=1387563 RepID=A0ACB8V1G4_9EURO|nr:uncharacterized protein LOZ57_000518 [Ophidiomyces ophidiicola]KAI1919246.1 hypothetical protein LOZ64_002366 [Ophidiomyces ophidiicola]KAI1927211.1 hypothetical protein LOZ60_003263 [Ophidiomyces ophidiicola]KAI1954168.1 hypothetical protein LOZ57_000518 [Ophidiomyces ophidiicola]KAI2007331.1 hypothetical protein LOZ50_002621 [Ophidiomyces ophidiicola]KAI2015128.1 hypothetical protein LOZ49_000881 [Ophidiomyces ophidiicola]
MAKDKERTVNPAQAQRRLEKQRALKKGKAELHARRNEKLARRNPERLQRQVDDLKAIEDSGQPLKPREKQILEGLEKDLRAVRKAREALGDKAPPFGRGEKRRAPEHDNPNRAVLGKRRREGHEQHRQHDDSSETDESVRNIPMPRDTPPPIPRRHPRRGPPDEIEDASDRQPHALPEKPSIAVKTVYESAPVIRDLRKEAVSKFVPSTVRMKQAAARGEGRLVEPEEMDRLEKAGYAPASVDSGSASMADTGQGNSEGQPASTEVDAATLAAEEERFRRELKHVHIEDVEDEDI